MLNKVVKFCLANRFIPLLAVIVLVLWGIVASPFFADEDFSSYGASVNVDAIPDISENQQIVYTEWADQVPQDIEDQISYPLTTALLGLPGVKTIRSNSLYGMSSIYVIFEDEIDFYWSRSRITEKLNALSANTLPDGVSPMLGPDATALGQVYWYTLEGRDSEGNYVGGWDMHELRTIQDYYVRYALSSVEGVAEVASIGGAVKEYQIDINPQFLIAYGVTIDEVIRAVKNSNASGGSRTIEWNRVEYMIRSLGYIQSIEDLEESVITIRENVPVRIKDVAHVSYGPATRRGGLDKNGREAVGGVIVARHGASPMKVIQHIKNKITQITPGLPSKQMEDGSVSNVTIVPFYDRSLLIQEIIGTLRKALTLEILITFIVVVVFLVNLRVALLVSIMLPITVLATFIAMQQFGVGANVVSLAGIAIAIGVMVDVGIIFSESIIQSLEKEKQLERQQRKNLSRIIYDAVATVSPSVATTMTTTIVSFLPVFALESAAGKLFEPLALTKTFSMLFAFAIGLSILPTLFYFLFSINLKKSKWTIAICYGLLIICGFILSILFASWLPVALIIMGFAGLSEKYWLKSKKHWKNYINTAVVFVLAIYFLSQNWVLPMGVYDPLSNFFLVAMMTVCFVAIFLAIIYYYARILSWCLIHRWYFLTIAMSIVLCGLLSWKGFNQLFFYFPESIKNTLFYQKAMVFFPGLGKEFMPSLEEGSFLLMPSNMPHAGVEENIESIRLLDKAVSAIPEVEEVVGKWGRVRSALDPAPIGMYENIIHYKPEYIVDRNGYRMKFNTNKKGEFLLKDSTTYDINKKNIRKITKADLIIDANGAYFRQWRSHIHSPDDIWNEVAEKSKILGIAAPPKLQPIETRLLMLQTGMRSAMGIKVFGPDVATIDKACQQIAKQLHYVEGVYKPSIYADRILGKPYIELSINREAIARYGLTIRSTQSAIVAALGGVPVSLAIEGRERYSIRVRYAREYRSSIEDIGNLYVVTPTGIQIPLRHLAVIDYVTQPQVIKSENGFIVNYVTFDKEQGFLEENVVSSAKKYLGQQIQAGMLSLPPSVSYQFTGTYENNIKANKKLSLIVPVSLIIICLIIYFRFKSVATTIFIFTGVAVAFSGGFIMLWLYGQPWFMNFFIGSIHFKSLFQVQPIHLSVAVWIGFIALLGIATDDGTLIAHHIQQVFYIKKPNNVQSIRLAIVEAGKKRVRPAMMTSATTVIALLPVITSTGKGSSIMMPMVIPLIGGMLVAIISIFLVPVLYAMWQENKIK